MTPVPAYVAKLLFSLVLLTTSRVYDLIYYTVYIGTLASTLCQVCHTFVLSLLTNLFKVYSDFTDYPDHAEVHEARSEEAFQASPGLPHHIPYSPGLVFFWKLHKRYSHCICPDVSLLLT